MICNECQTAGDFNINGKYVLAENFHKNCKGDCACQHKTGPGWFVGRGAKVPLMQRQSP